MKNVNLLACLSVLSVPNQNYGEGMQNMYISGFYDRFNAISICALKKNQRLNDIRHNFMINVQLQSNVFQLNLLILLNHS